jgi:hypothetical protein
MYQEFFLTHMWGSRIKSYSVSGRSCPVESQLALAGNRSAMVALMSQLNPVFNT